MHLGTALSFVNAFFVGLLAGAEIVIHYGMSGPAATLDERAQLQFRQALILKLRLLVPAIFLPALIFGIAVALQDVGAPGAGFRILGLVALLTWIAIRVVGTVPINSATLTWRLDAPPSDWRARVERAERFHIVGTWAAIVAFGAFLASVVTTAS